MEEAPAVGQKNFGRLWLILVVLIIVETGLVTAGWVLTNKNPSLINKNPLPQPDLPTGAQCQVELRSETGKSIRISDSAKWRSFMEVLAPCKNNTFRVYNVPDAPPHTVARLSVVVVSDRQVITKRQGQKILFSYGVRIEGASALLLVQAEGASAAEAEDSLASAIILGGYHASTGQPYNQRVEALAQFNTLEKMGVAYGP
jgi:hypothetical protein